VFFHIVFDKEPLAVETDSRRCAGRLKIAETTASKNGF